MSPTAAPTAPTVQHDLLRDFFGALRSARSSLLMLDYDGTLAPFTPERETAAAYPGVADRLTAIARGDRTRLVLVTGRPASDLVDLLGLDPCPEIWGVHGRQRRSSGGDTQESPVTPAAAEGLAAAARWCRGQGYDPYLERKPGALALHWRGLPPARAAGLRDDASRDWPLLAREAGLELRDFDGGLELRAPGPDKGGAVSALLAESAVVPVVAAYLGDDLTDEAAFLALHEATSRQAGAAGSVQGLGVLVRTEWRPTRADIWLRPPEELLDFLDRWLDATEGEGRSRGNGGR